MKRLILVGLLVAGCASSNDPGWQRAADRCDYESRLATGPRALSSGLAAAYQMRLYHSCMSAAGY